MSSSNKLDLLRADIDNIDQQILHLINQRGAKVVEIKALKEQEHADPIVYRPEREAQLLRQLLEENKGPLTNEQVAQIFRSIVAAGRELQKPLNIAFLGPVGTFSHAAVITHFGYTTKLAPTNTINDVVNVVKNGQANYGVLPIENSTEGVVNATLDALIGTSLQIISEIVLPIHHHLLIHPAHKNTISNIYSHPQSLAQCKIWLQNNFPQAQTIAVGSNAQAAELASKENGSAAIAGELAAKLYGLEKLNENIEDNINNSTRFLVIGRQAVPPSGNDKTSLFAYVSNTPGALAQLAQPFAKHQVNISLPALRPSGKEMWEYIFYLEIEGHQNDKQVQIALNELKENIVKIEILGSYPKAL